MTLSWPGSLISKTSLKWQMETLPMLQKQGGQEKLEDLNYITRYIFRIMAAFMV